MLVPWLTPIIKNKGCECGRIRTYLMVKQFYRLLPYQIGLHTHNILLVFTPLDHFHSYTNLMERAYISIFSIISSLNKILRQKYHKVKAFFHYFPFIWDLFDLKWVKYKKYLVQRPRFGGGMYRQHLYITDLTKK